ncbi:hypothetical protein ACRXH3_001774, partial [Campylobacter coli]
MIFLHRQNDLKSSIRNYGIEIDLRCNERLVLSHDVLEQDLLYPFFEEKIQFMKNIPIICNIKESGLEERVVELLGNKFEYYFLDS